MFGTEIHLITLVYASVQLVILVFQTINYMVRPNDKSRARFLLLTLAFIGYNIISGFVPDPQIAAPIIVQNIIAWIMGITTASYLLYYIYIEHSIAPLHFLNIKSIGYALLVSFVILFLIPYILTQDLNFARHLFLGLPLLLSLACLIHITYTLSKDFIASENIHYRFRIFSGGLGIISIFSLPAIILLLGDHQVIEHSAFSFGYFMIAIAYIKHHVYNSRIEYEFFTQHQPDTLANITTTESPAIIAPSALSMREKEIVLFLIAGYSNDRISEEIYISEQEVSQHIDAIFKSTGVDNADDLLELLPNSLKENPVPLVVQQKTKIPFKTTEEILNKLLLFENLEQFLNPNLSIQSLAKKINTNSKYLSITINTHKQQNFANYINSLRIGYAKQRIVEDHKFRQYTIQSIAKEVGFNTAEAFSKAFHKNSGQYPSQFIKAIDASHTT